MSGAPRVLGDRYEVGELLGRGGMAEVHAGRDQRLGRRVAIKLLRSDMARDPVFQARFRREAQSAAGLNHPAIVAVYDTGEDVRTESGGAQVRTPYIVMEHVPGRTVRDLLDEAGGGGLGTQRAVEITAGVLTALQAAHDAGIVHRDVKPANVMVTPGGGIKVMDFGIARAVADSSATMTQTSAVIGTAQYLSPEQARGEVVDARTDLYSTACLLYEALTGRPPFIGDSPVAVAYQHVGELPQPPSTHNRAVDDELDRVVLKALSKDREDRYADATEFRDDLGRATGAAGALTASSSSSERALLWPPAPRRSNRAVVASVGALVAVVLSLGAWLPHRAAQEPDLAAVQDVAGATPQEGDAGAVPSTAPPSGGEVTSGAGVVLTVAGVPAPVTVPGLVGKTQQQAADALEAQGLVLGDVSFQDVAGAPAGTVVDSDPQVGAEVAPTSSVAVAVARGRVTTDDLTGRSAEEAAQALAALGLTTTLAPEPSDRPAGQVLRQSPAGGASLPSGSVVTLHVSSGAAAVASSSAAPAVEPRTATVVEEAAPATPADTGASQPAPEGGTRGTAQGAAEAPSAQQPGGGEGKDRDRGAGPQGQGVAHGRASGPGGGGQQQGEVRGQGGGKHG